MRNAVHGGRMEDALDLVNDMNPALLDENPRLAFHLRLQQLIEIVRTGDIERTLAFARVGELDGMAENGQRLRPQRFAIRVFISLSPPT